MGNLNSLVSIVDSRLIHGGMIAGLAGGFAWTTYMMLSAPQNPGQEKLSNSSPSRLVVPIPIHSPRGANDSFLSLQSDEHSELDSEIERTALFIRSIKELIEITPEDPSIAPAAHSSRKRQLEQTLNRAEVSFNSLFELKSKLEQHEMSGLTLDSQITSEIAKCVANRDIDQQLVFSVARTNSLISGDASPFKKQRHE